MSCSGILVHELDQVIQFDAIAQFDEASNKVAWHLCPGCQKSEQHCSEADAQDTIAAWVYEHQETVVLGTLDWETRFPPSIRMMRQAGAAIALCARFPSAPCIAAWGAW